MSEATLLRSITRLADAAGWLVIRLNSGVAWDRTGQHPIRLAPPGTPDVLLLGPRGQVVFVECKATRGRLSRAQQAMHARLEARGHRVVVARVVDDVASVLGLLV